MHMDNAERAKREQDRLMFQPIEAMERRERIALLKMTKVERDKVFIELISSRPILALLAAVPPEDTQAVIDSCLRAWDERIAREGLD